MSNDAIEEARRRLNEYRNVITENHLWKMTQNICYEVRIEIKGYTFLRFNTIEKTESKVVYPDFVIIGSISIFLI